MALKYNLKRKTTSKPYFRVTIIADSNDADYITEITEEYLEYSENFLKALEMFFNIDFDENYSLRKGLKDLYKTSPDDYYYINEYINIPRDSWSEICHSLISFSIEYFDEDGSVYDVIFEGYEEWSN